MIMISLRKCDPQTSRAKTLTAKWKLCPKGKNEPSKELPKFSVKLFLHSSGHVAAKFQYDQAMFHGRLWMFPLSSLSEAEKVLGEISNYKVQLEVVKAKIKSAKSKDESESVKFTQKNLINKIYTNSADAKIPATLEYLGTFIEAGCKFLIFAHHQPMIDAIHECLLKKKVSCIWIDGGTPAASRQQLVEKDYIKAAVLSIKAGGVGLTLTAASTVIFTEQSWTPGDLIQAKDRAYRIGQKKKVGCIWIDGGTPAASRQQLVEKDYIKAAVVWWYFWLCISSMCFRYKHLFCCLGGSFAPREKMSLLKNCRSFLSNFFFIPVAMLQRNSNMTRLWMFPLSSLSEAEKVLGEISNYKVQAGCKFLIFAHHQPMIDAIHECLLKKKVGCIWIDGGTPAASRQQLVTDFQEKDYIKAAVLSIKAGGVGLTLTAASTVIFTEQSWTPGDLIQAKDRAYRIGLISKYILVGK
ncbi:chromatin-remodeling ATPase INO80 isoform X5 [Arachis duranensis]|uniref:Chromatin-remodeling ATPase INO80 isoform X5 n=1 Tax=Arachis duranensis TaxID=130453 RepID=A0A9C6TPS7_ARADU|nr:chromatin-remodeling ATPase INO80 isoform X5 [Arachis duranensis]